MKKAKKAGKVIKDNIRTGAPVKKTGSGRIILLLVGITLFMIVGTQVLLSQDSQGDMAERNQRMEKNQATEGHTEGFMEGFFEMLSSILIESGWSDEEVAALIEEARKLEWYKAEKADPEVVALALQLGKKEGIDFEPMEQARLAIEVANTAVEMEMLGYSERMVARSTLNGVRNMLGDIREWKQEGKKAKLGPIIQNHMKAQVRIAAMSQVHEYARKRVKKQNKGASENGFSCIPGESSPWSSSYTDESQYTEPNINIPGKP